MTVKELKQSLERFGHDDDNNQVVLQTIDPDGNLDYQILAFTGYSTDEKLKCVILGSEDAAYYLIKRGLLNKDEFDLGGLDV